jgi:hypothetical protein
MVVSKAIMVDVDLSIFESSLGKIENPILILVPWISNMVAQINEK